MVKDDLPPGGSRTLVVGLSVMKLPAHSRQQHTVGDGKKERHQQVQVQHELAQAAAVAAALEDERERHQQLLRDTVMAAELRMGDELQAAKEEHQRVVDGVAAAATEQHMITIRERHDLRQQLQSLADEYKWERVRRQVTDMSLIKGPAPAAGVPAEAKARSVLVTVPRFADHQLRVIQLLAGMAVLDQKMISCERVDNGGPADAPLGTWRVKLASGMLCRRLQAYTGTVKAHCEELGSLSLLVCRLRAPRAFSSEDWLENVINLPKSRLLLSIQSHLLFNTAWAAAVSVVHGMTPEHYFDHVGDTTMPHSIMASALGLLLVFRSNASYDRFWEARKVWGCITNTTRNLARLTQSCMSDEDTTYRAMLEYLKAYPWLLKQHLQDTRDDTEFKWLALPESELELLLSNPNPPLMACERMTQVIQLAYGTCGGSGVNGGRCREDDTSVAYRLQMEVEVGKLVDFLGMCERILTTPVPRSYSRHTSRFLTVYLFTLPMVLVGHTGYWTAAVVGLICWGLLSIEGIAYYIEQPFDAGRQQLPLASYCQKMYMDITRISSPTPLPVALDLERIANVVDKSADPPWACLQQQATAAAGQPSSAASVSDTE
ncbi:Bestrophin, RFP-TM, chloride channel-domain-containing protein [Tribonema minus]|uniref:Bestrophin, RFP-TM, chloride channel-domain-containing protein n=1 Tax=Tribonema minus TaxID=303371 RepID=A0A836CJD6_9STRA|nr:Bestrophin, RFP-TM, chloride channel-domain-containing protein [Tribonema minus]